MAGRPAKPNKLRVQVKIDDGVLAAVDAAAAEIGTDRSQTIEDVLAKYVTNHVANHRRKLAKPPRKK